MLVPDSNDDATIGDTWQGNPADEPFDDSPTAGWIAATGAIGYDTGQLEGPVQGTLVTVGASLSNRSSTDILSGSVFMMQEFPFGQDGTLTNWSIYGDATGTITPLILQNTGNGFDITGIGTSRSGDGSGRQDFEFELVSGSADVGDGYFFAWKDGTLATNNSGVIDYQPNTNDQVRWFGQQIDVALGGDLGSGFLLSRTYSVQATYFVPSEGGTGGTTADATTPLAYWNFDGTLEDASGGGRTAQLQGATFSDETPALLAGGQSLWFDGVDDFARADLDVSETSYTTSLWFRAEASGRGLFAVVDADLGGGGHDRHIYLSGGNVATRVWNNETITSSGTNYADGAWHHITHVVGGDVGGQRIYVDGQLVATGAKASSDFNWQQAINIGFSNDAASDFFSGWIDDGFVAYLNGVEVARRNAPQDLSFDSVATADRKVADAIAFDDVDLSASIPLLREGTNVLAIQALNDSADSTNFLLSAELVKVDTNANRFMSRPTPTHKPTCLSLTSPTNRPIRRAFPRSGAAVFRPTIKSIQTWSIPRCPASV